jgi:hypothetical protein
MITSGLSWAKAEHTNSKKNQKAPQHYQKETPMNETMHTIPPVARKKFFGLSDRSPGLKVQTYSVRLPGNLPVAL